MATDKSVPREVVSRSDVKRQRVPELYQVVIECGDEAEQRELYERLRAEGMRVRVLVL